MAFPTIPTVAGGRVLVANQANATSPRTFPSLTGLTKNDGDLLIAIICAYQSSAGAGAPGGTVFSSWGGSFTEFCDQMTTASSTMAIGAAYKRSTGSETGTFTVAQVATITGHASMILLSIPAVHATSPPEVSTIVNGTAAAANPASFDPAGWAAEDTLWIAVGASGMTAITGSWTGMGSAGPTSFTDYVETATVDSSVVGQTELAVAFRQQNASSQDVATFAGLDVSNARNSAVVIAVRPGVAHTVGPSDTVALADGRTMSRGILVPDTIALADGWTMSRGILVPDTIELADDASPVNEPPAGTDHEVPIDDTVALADARALSIGVAVADSLVLADARALSRGKAVTDALAVSDSASTAKAIAQTITDGLGAFRSDDFNRADENPLAGDWTTGTGNQNLKIVSGSVMQQTVDSNNEAAIYDGITWPDDQWSAARFSVNCTAGGRRGPALYVRYAAAANTGYRISVDHAASTNCNISRFLAGVRTTLVNFTQAWTDGDEWRLVVDGPASAARLRVYLNGTLIQTFTDDSSIASGYPGIGVSDDSLVLDVMIDDWSGGALSPISDSVSTAKGKAVSIDDSVSLADSFSRVMAYGRTQADGINLADQVLDAQGIRLGDVVALVDELARVTATARAVIDAIELADARTLSRGKAVVDTVALSDQLARVLALARTLTDSVVLSDQLSTAMTKARTLQDSVTLADARALSRGKALADSVALADQLARTASSVRVIADTVSLTDFISPSVAGAGQENIDDFLVLSDSFTRVATYARSLSDALSVSDAVATAKTTPRSISDSLAVTDQLTRTVTYVRSVADTIALADQATPQKSGAGATSIDDLVAIADSLTIALGIHRELADVVFLDDRISTLIALDPSAFAGTIVTGTRSAFGAAARLAAAQPSSSSAARSTVGSSTHTDPDLTEGGTRAAGVSGGDRRTDE